jgi:hypothetical protein
MGWAHPPFNRPLPQSLIRLFRLFSFVSLSLLLLTHSKTAVIALRAKKTGLPMFERSAPLRQDELFYPDGVFAWVLAFAVIPVAIDDVIIVFSIFSAAVAFMDQNLPSKTETALVAAKLVARRSGARSYPCSIVETLDELAT